MLFFDQLKKNDAQLRTLAITILAGLCALVAGLWWVQIVSAREYQLNQETQSSRSVRIPAVRGKILDRRGEVLAENRAAYNVSLFLDEFRKPFETEAAQRKAKLRKELLSQRTALEKNLGRKLNKTEQKAFTISLDQLNQIKKEARYAVSSNTVYELGRVMNFPQPQILNSTNFERHYLQTRALPFAVFTNLTTAQIALFEEKCASWTNVDVETLSVRIYPHGNTAAHIIGYVKRDDTSAEGEDADFSYRVSGFKGQLGIEAGYDKELRGKAGKKSVHVNSAGYRQTEDIELPGEAGTNVFLTLDLTLQEATERALRNFTSKPKAAAVVMDVWTGDILALASKPSYNPNIFLKKITQEDLDRLQDPDLAPQLNRATRGAYAPGSIFKTVIALAALDAGLDDRAQYTVQANPKDTAHGIIYLGRGPGSGSVRDTAPPGLYDFKKALIHSSNAYFVNCGLAAGIEKIVAVGERLHFAETTGLPTRQDVAGSFPTRERVRTGWHDGDTANVCIGANPVLVSPLQMAVLASAIANGGTVLWPRLVDKLAVADTTLAAQPITFPKGRIRDRLNVSERSMNILRTAMLADVEEAGGTGHAAYLPDMRICGKTGTAQVKDPHGKTISHNVWFLSYAPYNAPRYAVVVMIEDGTSGGGDCAPIGGEIYRAIRDLEKNPAAKAVVTNQ